MHFEKTSKQFTEFVFKEEAAKRGHRATKN